MNTGDIIGNEKNLKYATILLLCFMVCMFGIYGIYGLSVYTKEPTIEESICGDMQDIYLAEYKRIRERCDMKIIDYKNKVSVYRCNDGIDYIVPENWDEKN